MKKFKNILCVIGPTEDCETAGFIMGNTAVQILSHIDCSVLAIKPVGFVTPVTL